MATNWLVYGGIAALLAAAYFFRCKIPFLNKYLCPGGEAGMPMEAPPMDQPMPLPMPMPAPMPVPGGVGAGIGMPADWCYASTNDSCCIICQGPWSKKKIRRDNHANYKRKT